MSMRGPRDVRPPSFTRMAHAARRAVALAPEWQAWVAENLLLGLARDALVETLVANGVARTIATREVRAIDESAPMRGARNVATRLRRLEMVAALRQRLAGVSRVRGAIERRSGVSGDEFFERYYAANQPVVLTDMMRGWPALERWSPAYFKERLGDVEIAVTADRDSDPDYDMHTPEHTTTMTMAAFVDKIAAAGPTNDFYMVANNKNIERAAVRALLDDCRPPLDYFDPDKLEGATSLWLGPAGTVTPLHHDTSNILFHQVYGRKRVRLASPLETALLYKSRGVYAAIDCDAPAFAEEDDLRDVTMADVVLEPGEALFIPVGWWHQVRALEVSINISFLNFERPNHFAWYLPGT